MSVAEKLAAAARAAGQDYGGCQVLPLRAARKLARRFGVPLVAVYEQALAAGVMPLRYARNLGTIGTAGQLALLRSTVAVVGLGGLGGFIVDGLARMGVGRIIAVDGDAFEEHNLNRQLLGTDARLGQPKAAVAAVHVAEINGAVAVEAHQARLTREGAVSLLRGAQVVVDALDNVPDRLVLQEAAAALGAPLVHGAIAGFVGQVLVVFPGDAGLRALYPGETMPDKGVEQVTGNPAATPMIVAGLQLQEVVKLVTGVGAPLRGAPLLIDTEQDIFERLELGR